MNGGVYVSLTKANGRRKTYPTPEAIRKKNLKNKLWRRYTRTRGNYDCIQFNSVKNELRSLTRKLKLVIERSLAQNIKISPKSFWAYVKTKTNTRSKIAVTSIDKAETLNTFFSSNFTDERLDDIPNNPDEPFLGEYLNSFVITPKLVQEKIQELNSGKTPSSLPEKCVGLDNRTSKILVSDRFFSG